jgi:hypothetical protein
MDLIVVLAVVMAFEDQFTKEPVHTLFKWLVLLEKERILLLESSPASIGP